MTIHQRTLGIYLTVFGLFLAASSFSDVKAQTNRQSSKRIYVSTAWAPDEHSLYPLDGVGAQKLVDALKRNTTVSLPKGPQGGLEITFVAVIARHGDVLGEWESHPVHIEGGIWELRPKGANTGTAIRSPWEAFDTPIVGFQEPLVGFLEPFLAYEEALLGFGKPVAATPFTYDARLRTTADAVAAIWGTNGVALGDGYALILMAASPRDAAATPQTIAPAVVPFTVRETPSLAATVAEGFADAPLDLHNMKLGDVLKRGIALTFNADEPLSVILAAGIVQDGVVLNQAQTPAFTLPQGTYTASDAKANKTFVLNDESGLHRIEVPEAILDIATDDPARVALPLAFNGMTAPGGKENNPLERFTGTHWQSLSEEVGLKYEGTYVVLSALHGADKQRTGWFSQPLAILEIISGHP